MLAEQQNISKMKKKNILWLIAFALLMPLFALTACSDDDDDDNDSTGDKTEQTANDGTKVLSKKVTKIVETEDDGDEYTYNFDEDGKITSYKHKHIYDNDDISIHTYTYSKDQIVENSSSKTTTYNLENGRVVHIEERNDGGHGKSKYITCSYSSDGYLASLNSVKIDADYEKVEEAKYTVTDGNHTKYEELEESEDYGVEKEEELTISYNSKLNNLNVDLAGVIIGIWPTEFFGKRSKNLPISINWKYKYRSYIDRDGNPQYRVNNETTIFTYTYDGDYPVKVLEEWTETSDGGSSDSGTRTYEIFYE